MPSEQVQPNQKVCRVCEKPKPTSAYAIQKKANRKAWTDNTCKNCRAIMQQKKRDKIRNSPPEVVEIKKCRICKKTKHFSKFPIHRQYKDHRDTGCRKCLRKRKFKQILKWRYNISPNDYLKIYKEQNRGCKICGITRDNHASKRFRPLDVDHDHKTGKIRSLLCNRCNLAIHHLEYLINENLLQKASDYVNSYSCNPVQSTVE